MIGEHIHARADSKTHIKDRVREEKEMGFHRKAKRAVHKEEVRVDWVMLQRNWGRTADCKKKRAATEQGWDIPRRVNS